MPTLDGTRRDTAVYLVAMFMTHVMCHDCERQISRVESFSKTAATLMSRISVMSGAGIWQSGVAARLLKTRLPNIRQSWRHFEQWTLAAWKQIAVRRPDWQSSRSESGCEVNALTMVGYEKNHFRRAITAEMELCKDSGMQDIGIGMPLSIHSPWQNTEDAPDAVWHAQKGKNISKTAKCRPRFSLSRLSSIEVFTAC